MRTLGGCRGARDEGSQRTFINARCFSRAGFDLDPRAVPLVSVALVIALVAVPVSVVAAIVTPTFTNFAKSGTNAGEPSIGVNTLTHNVMFQSGLSTYRVTFANSSLPVTASWTSVGPLATSVVSLDSILYTDQSTHRTFVAQLTGACSLMAYTDTDGSAWTQNPAGCAPGAAPDHETVGGGPFAAPLTGGAAKYADGVYYCAQGDVEASCGLSLDGGLTFGPASPMYTLAQCSGLHGHVRVGPDGAAYVPNKHCTALDPASVAAWPTSCGSACAAEHYPNNAECFALSSDSNCDAPLLDSTYHQGVAVSADNGLTWTVHTIPNSTTQSESDPSVAVGSGGKAYFCYQDGDGHPKAVTTTDHGATWSSSVDLGSSNSIQNSQFPAVIAGDNDRAACAWLGTTTSGDDQSTSFAGTWNLYVSFTYDGGATWTTVKASTHTIQTGTICMQGTTCPSGRNLLDFMDISLDSDGRVVVGYPDGSSGGAIATIARQDGSTTGLFSAKTLGN